MGDERPDFAELARQKVTAADRAAAEEFDGEQFRLACETARNEYRGTSGLVGEMWEHRLATYPGTSESQRAAAADVSAYVENWGVEKVGRFMSGDCGVGKSGLNHGCAVALLEREEPVRVRYVACRGLSGETDARLRDLAESCRKSRVVFLDDPDAILGAGAGASAGREFVRLIVDAADRDRGFALWVTSNLGPEEWRARWPDLASRLEGLTKPIHIVGPDLRSI